MQCLHFNTIDLRNKLSRGCITNNCPIIAEDTAGNNVTMQVRMEIYPSALPYWCEIRGYLHEEMNLHIKASYYEALSKINIYTPMQSQDHSNSQKNSGQGNADHIVHYEHI